MDENSVRQIINEVLKNYLSDNKVDDGRVTSDELDFLVNNKIDKRNTVDHTFTTTSAESFEHNLGRTPIGAIVIAQSKAATILVDKSLFTTKRISATSSVSSNVVRFLIL